MRHWYTSAALANFASEHILLAMFTHLPSKHLPNLGMNPKAWKRAMAWAPLEKPLAWITLPSSSNPSHLVQFHCSFELICLWKFTLWFNWFSQLAPWQGEVLRGKDNGDNLRTSIPPGAKKYHEISTVENHVKFSTELVPVWIELGCWLSPFKVSNVSTRPCSQRSLWRSLLHSVPGASRYQWQQAARICSRKPHLLTLILASLMSSSRMTITPPVVGASLWT